MSERDELTELLIHSNTTGSPSTSLCIEEHYANTILAAGYRKPRVITTAEELDALPPWTVVRSEQGTIWEKFEGQHSADFWAESMSLGKHPGCHIALPATVLYEGTTP